MQDAITVLTLLFGLAGVVVGYYFGRVPAEARAVEAQARANVASDAMDLATKTEQGSSTKPPRYIMKWEALWTKLA